MLKKRSVTRILKEPHLTLNWQRGKQEEKLGVKASPSPLAHLGRKQVTDGSAGPGEESDSSGKASKYSSYLILLHSWSFIPLVKSVVLNPGYT